MAKGVNYDVTATLKAVDKASGTFARVGGSVDALGRSMRGTAFQSAAMYGKIAAGAGVAAGAGGLGLLVSKGLSFNRVMENTQGELGVIYQMFGQNQALGENVGMAEQFAANLDLAKDSMDELYEIAKKSPASFKNVANLYKNLSAGLATATDDVSRQVDFVSKAVLAGGLTGGDYDVLGAQMGRIMAGSAGAEMNVWKVLQKPIKEAGVEMGVFNKEMKLGADLTQKFNEMAGIERLEIMEKVLGELGGPVADYFANTMSGILSTTQSAIEQLTGTMTEGLYENFRQFLIRLNSSEGAFGGSGMVQMMRIAETIGNGLTIAADYTFAAIERGADYMAKNWENVAMKLGEVFDTAWKAAKLYMKFAAARAIAGVGVSAVGKGMGIAGKVGSGIANIGEQIAENGAQMAKLGRIALYAAPALAALAAIAGGLAVVFGGVVASFVDKWDQILAGFQSGQITLDPLIEVLDMFWNKMVAVGESFLGSSDPIEMTQNAIDLAAEGFSRLAGVMGGMLEVAGWTMVVLDNLYGVYQTIYGAMYSAAVSVAEGILWVLNKVVGWAEDILPEGVSRGLQGALDAVDEHRQKAMDFTKENALELGNTESKFLDAAKAFHEAGSTIGGDSAVKGFFESLIPKQPEAPMMGPEIPPGYGGKPMPTKDKSAMAGKGDVNIGHLTVNQDLRNTDPDRIMAAMIDPLKEMADRPKQSYFTTLQGM